MSSSRVERCYNIAELRKLAKTQHAGADVPLHRRRRRRRMDPAPQHGRVRQRGVHAARARRRLEDRHVDDAVRPADRLAVFLRADGVAAPVPSRGRGRHGARRARERHDLLAVERLVDEHRGCREAVARAEGVPGLHVQGSRLEPRVRAAREGLGLRRAAAHRRRHGLRQSRARHRDGHDGAAEARADEPDRHRDEAEVGLQAPHDAEDRGREHRAPAAARQREARRHHPVPERADRPQHHLEGCRVDDQGVGRPDSRSKAS